MAYSLLLLGILLLGLVLIALGAVLLFKQKNKLTGAILLVLGVLTGLFSVLGFLFLVIASRTMG